MGLDMYLQNKNGDELVYWRKANQIHNWFGKHCANGNLENCEEYEVTKEQLRELRDTCKKVLDSCNLVMGKSPCKRYDSKTDQYITDYIEELIVEDPSIAKELLPTTEGFFYGDTNYNEYYVEDVKYTLERIAGVIECYDYDAPIKYYAWW